MATLEFWSPQCWNSPPRLLLPANLIRLFSSFPNRTPTHPCETPLDVTFPSGPSKDNPSSTATNSYFKAFKAQKRTISKWQFHPGTLVLEGLRDWVIAGNSRNTSSPVVTPAEDASKEKYENVAARYSLLHQIYS